MFILGYFVPIIVLWVVIGILAIPNIIFFLGLFSRRVTVKKVPLVLISRTKSGKIYQTRQK
jgi:hypothetical protein